MDLASGQDKPLGKRQGNKELGYWKEYLLIEI